MSSIRLVVWILAGTIAFVSASHVVGVVDCPASRWRNWLGQWENSSDDVIIPGCSYDSLDSYYYYEP